MRNVSILRPHPLARIESLVGLKVERGRVKTDIPSGGDSENKTSVLFYLQLRIIPAMSENRKFLSKKLTWNLNLVTRSRVERLNMGKLVGNVFQNLVLEIWSIA